MAPMTDDFENNGQDITVHQRWVADAPLPPQKISIEHAFTKWFINDCKVGDYIHSRRKVYRIDAVPGSDTHWVFTHEPGVYSINLVEVENVTEGHKLYIKYSEYLSSACETFYDASHILFLQNKGDVEKYLYSLFFDGEYHPEYADRILHWYECYLFGNHLNSLDHG